jgi:hypothetical protein
LNGNGEPLSLAQKFGVAITPARHETAIS